MSIAAAVFLHNSDAILPEVELALAQLPNVQRYGADTEVCKAFQTARLPMLVLYNADGDETARAFGNVHVQELIKQTAAEL